MHNPPSGKRVRCWAQSEDPAIVEWAVQKVEEAGLHAEAAEEPGYVDIWFPAMMGFVYGEDPVYEALDYLREAGSKWVPARGHCRIVDEWVPARGHCRIVDAPRGENPRTGRRPPATPGPRGGRTHVQTLLFEKRSYSRAQAAAWAREHGYHSTIDEGANYWRARQYDPSSKERYRTIMFGKGVKAVIGASGAQQNPLSERERKQALTALHRQWLLHDAEYYERRGGQVKSTLTDEERQEALERLAEAMERKEKEWEGRERPREDVAAPRQPPARGGGGQQQSQYRRNPGHAPPPARVASAYIRFHGHEPENVTEGRLWVPGPMVYVGAAVDIGYDIIDRKSTKDGGYDHDHKGGVKVYRRAATGEKGDVHWQNFPQDLWVLGKASGFGYTDAETGTLREVRGSSRLKLATNSAGNMLVVVDSTGVQFVVKGGKLKVTDWIRN